MNVGIWIRVSTEEQARGDSPRNHEARARMYAELKGWRVVEVYDLSGVSGKSVLTHPEAQRMLRDVSSGRIKALIFSKLARLARNVRELLEISEYFQKHGADLISLDESIDTSTPAGRLLFTVIGALAQWEREEISSRVKASVKVRALQGKPVGGQGPFGYRWVDKRLVVDEAEARIVREIYETYLKTKRLLRTAEIINLKGYRTRKGKKFRATSIKRILTDPVYKGMKRANYTRSRGEKKSWVLKPREEWVYHEVEPVVSEELWENVNRILNQRAELYGNEPPPPAGNGKYAFSGLLYCSCGTKMYVIRYRGMKVPRYVCRSCRNKINEDVLIEKFREGLEEVSLKPERLREAVSVSRKEIEEKERMLSGLRKQLSHVRNRIDRLLDLYGDGSLDRDSLEEKLKALQERKNALQDEINRLEGEIDYLKITELGRDYVLTKITSLTAVFDELNSEEKMEVIKELTSKIVVSKERVEIEYFYLPSLMEVGKSSHNLRDSWQPPA